MVFERKEKAEMVDDNGYFLMLGKFTHVDKDGEKLLKVERKGKCRTKNLII